MKPILLALALIGGPATADTVDAQTAVAVDAASTAIGIGAGAAEANPLGWATIPLRIAVLEHAKTLPEGEKEAVQDAVSATGWGAAAGNLAVIAGASAAALVVGIAVGYAVWVRGEERREFLRLCQVHKDLAHDQALRCIYRS